MAVAGLFSGIGGFELAFQRAGFVPNLLVEIDPLANALLKARFPDVEVQGDVSDITKLPRGTTILTAGFPCQNLSMAGDKSGIKGTRSRVIKQMFQLIAKSRVPLVVIENVYFMLHLESGGGMRWLTREFEKLGYRWAYRVLDTMGFGLPQRRRRVYLVASVDLDPRTILFADDGAKTVAPKPSLDKPLGFYWTEGRSGIGLTADGIPPLKVGSALGIPSAPAVLFLDGEVLMPSLRACEQLQGFDREWTALDAHKGLRRSPEWRMLGNAVSVPVAKWVAGRIKAPGKVLDFEEHPLSISHSWPDAAWNIGKGRRAIVAGDKPIELAKRSISDFRDETWTRLSDRALDGFISRLREGGLSTPQGFRGALRRAERKPSYSIKSSTI